MLQPGTVRVFAASMSDVFEDYRGDGASPDRPVSLDPWRRELFDLIERIPFLEWLVLSKRPEFARDFFRHCILTMFGSEPALKIKKPRLSCLDSDTDSCQGSLSFV